MSKRIASLAILGIAAVLAACDMSIQEEFTIAEPEPITVDRTFSGKY
ncbi:hypothetical protein ACFMPD_09940 [Sedimentitalea sp. HM32M-2]